MNVCYGVDMVAFREPTLKSTSKYNRTRGWLLVNLSTPSFIRGKTVPGKQFTVQVWLLVIFVAK